MKFIASGKVKDIYELEDEPGHLLFRFSDRVSAYDVKFSQDIPRKGEILCRSAEFWFGRLSVPNHFVRRASDTDIVVRRMRMLPIECVVRGYLYGSMYDRWRDGTLELPEGSDTRLASRLSKPVFDPTTKSEHDVPVNREAAVGTGLVSGQQYDWLEEQSIRIYEDMSRVADSAGFILADLKLEFGIPEGEGGDGQITLGDSIGPDEYRMWPKDSYNPGDVQTSYDKQILRDWLAEHGYKKKFEEERSAGRTPTAPEIPPDMVSAMTRRYVDSFGKIAGVRV